MKKIIVMLLVLVVALCCACSATPSTGGAPVATSASDSGSTYYNAAPNPEKNTASDGYAGEEPRVDEYYDYDSAPSTSSGSYRSNERYLDIAEHSQTSVEDISMLTFSLKVDTASYTNARRYIDSGSVPPADAVRVEEFINYFKYDYEMRFTDDNPFSIYTEIGASPFDAAKRMAFIRVKTREIDRANLPPSNLVFLIDTSGSMNSYDKLPLLIDSMLLLTDTLTEDDRVSIVTYAGNVSTVLEGAPGSDKRRIQEALKRLSAGGSTAGASGIEAAYRQAESNFIKDGNNRVILASDGDFNVGISNVDELSRFIQGKRKNGVMLSVLGFGTGNLRDDIMETLAKDGNGNYNYIDSLDTAQKVLVDELAGNLFVVAEDVKAQVEFNPQNVSSYRLIGYENRMLENRDFADDTKDAGEVGAGNDMILLFELTLVDDDAVPAMKYQDGGATTLTPKEGQYGDELFEVRLRYKDPGASSSRLITHPVTFERIPLQNSSDFGFASAVAAFGGLLRGSDYAQNIRYNDVLDMAQRNIGADWDGYRKGFVELVERYMGIR